MKTKRSTHDETKSAAQRRSDGVHYTDRKQILKLIKPLFLNEYRRRYLDREDLLDLHRDIATVTFLDPACGSGNFLALIHEKLVEIEDKILALHPDSPHRVSWDQFHGIELDPGAAQRAPGVIQTGNSLAMEWPDGIDYIVGNPPFRGGSRLSPEQKADRARVFSGQKSIGQLDYVACWYRMAADYMVANGATRAAFVSTNSITQGVQPSLLWPSMLERGMAIDFAHRTFAWKSDSTGKANVHCVIVGFSSKGVAEKELYDYDDPKGLPQVRKVSNINPYLVDGPDVLVTKRSKPISAVVPEMGHGSMPIDGGNLLLTQEEKDELVAECPLAEKWIKPYMMGREFLHNIPRYCLWLVGVTPAELKAMPPVLKRVEAVREMRLASTAKATRELAKTPHLFASRRHTGGSYLALPVVSSERRNFIPIGYNDDSVVAGNNLFTVPNATLYHFGILNSTLHQAWMRAVGGRLESDYSYSNTVVYNTMVWPTDIPEMELGSMPRDGGNLLLTQEEKEELVSECPLAAKWIKPFMGAKEFLHNIPRYCLWLVGVTPAELKAMPAVLKRVEGVREMRLASAKRATRELAKTPHLFGELRHAGASYIAIPLISSERREYIPVEYSSPTTIPSNRLFTLPNATLYHFGILNSTLHNAWMRTVAGRLENSYSYSSTIVYNNFVWPTDIPEMGYGSMPIDGGQLLMTQKERDELVSECPLAVKWIKPFMGGAREFLYDTPRYCLWLVGVTPAELKAMPPVLKRVEAVKEMRLASTAKATRELAKTPHLFASRRHTGGSYLALPRISSERRSFIPIGYNESSVVAGDRLFTLPNATIYHFGILNSSMHQAWMRTVAGRLESRYNYSNTVVYNTMVWPTEVQPVHRGLYIPASYTLTEEARDILLAGYPQADKWIRPYVGGREILHDIPRYCLWLEGITEDELAQLPDWIQELPPIQWPDTNIACGDLLIPVTTSKRRDYIPVAYADRELALAEPNMYITACSLYTVAMFLSSIHNAWMRTVAGRLGNSYRYSSLVYNNFSHPMITPAMKKDVEDAAQGILDARALYPDMCLADLYNPDTMPIELKKAHQYLDVLVNLLYGFEGPVKESQLVARMFELYAAATAHGE